MTLPFNLPLWLPWWLPLVLLVPALLWLLAFLAVPFSVIGVKSRLDGLEARLDEIQAEIRTLALRLPEAGPAVDFDELYTAPEPVEPAKRAPVVMSRPPIPPAVHELEEEGEPHEAPPSGSPPRTANRSDPPRREGRLEPRLDWPR
jgi:hypothetical protein